MHWYGFIKSAASSVQSLITTNKAGLKFFTIIGNTFPIKDKLSTLGFRYFKGSWGMSLERAKGIRPQIEALGVDTASMDSEMATAPLAGVQVAQPQPQQSVPQLAPQPESKVDQTLAQMRKAIDDEMKSGQASDKAKNLLRLVDDMIEGLATSVDEAAKSEFVRSFLDFSAKFHNYSFGNQILIWVQKRDATYVSGYKGWLEKGRQVTDWTGISILAPRKVSKDLSDEQKARLPADDPRKASGKAEYMYFAPVKVYDISATQPIPGWKSPDGKPPFEPSKWRMDPNEEQEHITLLVKSAVAFASSVGIKVDLEKALSGGTGGYSAGGEVAVNKTHKGINQFSTIVHELAHEVLHRQEDQKSHTMDTRQSKEIDAETTAYVVLKHFGYDTKDAPNYLALWMAKGQDVKARRNNVAKAVRIIVNGIDSAVGKMDVAEEAIPEPAATQPAMARTMAWVKMATEYHGLPTHPIRLAYEGEPIFVRIEPASVKYQGLSDAGHGWAECSFDAVAIGGPADGRRYHGTVDAELGAGIFYWDNAQIEGQYEAKAPDDPHARMYDLHKKMHERTSEEDTEMEGLIRQHGRPKYMASRNDMATTQKQSWVRRNCRFAQVEMAVPAFDEKAYQAWVVKMGEDPTTLTPLRDKELREAFVRGTKGLHVKSKPFSPEPVEYRPSGNYGPQPSWRGPSEMKDEGYSRGIDNSRW